MNFAKTLSRNEMKNISGGGCCNGNIHCTAGGQQYFCTTGSENEQVNALALDLCLAGCAEMGDCGGCAQFPELEE